MMVRPDCFGYNPETAASNAFQQAADKDNIENIREQALAEFNGLVSTLKASGTEVIVFGSDDGRETPDAVFPNNWVSFHPDGKVILYPMLAPSRRQERRLEFITALEKQHSFEVGEIIDLSDFERQGLFLEGTGSLVMDYLHGVIYCNHSPRTDKILVNKVAEILGFTTCQFTATDSAGQDIYHTNVLMCVGESFAVVCLEAITNLTERSEVELSLQKTGHEVIEITQHQLNQFAGNMMEMKNNHNQSILVMSEGAYNSLTDKQLSGLAKYSELVYSPVDTIEKYGGGSVRCMLAGVFLPRKQ